MKRLKRFAIVIGFLVTFVLGYSLYANYMVDGEAKRTKFSKAMLVENATVTLREKPTTAGHAIAVLRNSDTLDLSIKRYAGFEDGYHWVKVGSVHGSGYIIVNRIKCKRSKRRYHFTRIMDGILGLRIARVSEPNDASSQSLIDSYEQKLLGGFRTSIEAAWWRMTWDLPMIKSIARDHGVPEDLLIGVLLTESHWLPHAPNHADAAGYAQFIPGTAADEDIEVSNRTDERYNKRTSVVGCAKYLAKLKSLMDAWETKYSYSMSESDAWLFAATAYNRGAGNLRSNFKSCKGDFDKYLEFAPASNIETREYVPKILATIRVMSELRKSWRSYDHLYAHEYLFNVYRSKKPDMDMLEREVFLRSCLSVTGVGGSGQYGKTARRQFSDEIKIIEGRLKHLAR